MRWQKGKIPSTFAAVLQMASRGTNSRLHLSCVNNGGQQTRQTWIFHECWHANQGNLLPDLNGVGWAGAASSSRRSCCPFGHVIGHTWPSAPSPSSLWAGQRWTYVVSCNLSVTFGVAVCGRTFLRSLTSINIDILWPSSSTVCPQSLRELPLPGKTHRFGEHIFFPRSWKRWIIYSLSPPPPIPPPSPSFSDFFLLTGLNV